MDKQVRLSIVKDLSYRRYARRGYKPMIWFHMIWFK